MNGDRGILTEALERAVPAYEATKEGHTILGQPAPTDTILGPISAAIEKCDTFRTVSGHVLFSANSGIVLQAHRLALDLLHKADRGIPAAVDWLIGLLRTRYAKGIFNAAIWGLSAEEEIHFCSSSRLVPFALLPPSRLKDVILERSRKIHDNSAWVSSRWFDKPQAGFFREIPDFPYIRTEYLLNPAE